MEPPLSDQNLGGEIDMASYLSKLTGIVKENINKLKENSLFGIVIGNPMSFERLCIKLKRDWGFLNGEFHISPRGNNWFEIRFADPVDRKRIWDGRPYHICSQLLVLRPWISFFDPLKESSNRLDMWVRILQLPSEFISFDVLKIIIEMNQVGELIKLDPYTEKGDRVSYPRLCINARKEDVIDCKVVVSDELGFLHEYVLWCEEFPKGCGFCGEETHLFPECPLKG